MQIRFEEFKDEIDNLVDFLTSDTWEFYGTPNLKAERIRASYENQYYTGEYCKTFWVILDDDIKAGMIRIYDLEDETTMFDIRILREYKGMGIGTSTVKWLTNYVFTSYDDKSRIEANTRQDNYAMRCVFHRCGYTKESHHRKAWPTQGGQVYDSVGYAITKEDWEKDGITPVEWNDFKC